nr:BPK_HP1_G0043830.mRNA.1.CDS.1 [Saccharomyces cerevisiae]
MKSVSSKERDSDEDEAVILGGVTAEAHIMTMSEEPLVEGLQSDNISEKKDHSENEEEFDTIYGDITSANIHSNAPDDIKRQTTPKESK